MKIPRVQNKAQLIIGTILALMCWLPVLTNWATYPAVSGFWFAVGLIFLALGITNGVFGWHEFWMYLIGHPIISLILAITSFGLVLLLSQFYKENPFLTGITCVIYPSAITTGVMFLMSFVIGSISRSKAS